LVKDAETAFGMSCVLSTPQSVDSIDRNRPLQFIWYLWWTDLAPVGRVA